MKRFFFTLMTLVIVFIGIISCNQGNKNVPDEETQAREVWSAEQAQQWYKQWGWLRGADFIPSTAINQLEMWQAETFDPETINRELGYAESIGYNSMRVYLHHLAWQIDTAGFKNRMKEYLNIADQHGISTLFVFFDDCWNPTYKAGQQPDPKPGIHNSGWVRDPGDSIFINPAMIGSLEKYVKDILRTFSSDSRIVLWDVYNEPGNSVRNKSLPLHEKSSMGTRNQSITTPFGGIWNWDLKELSDFRSKIPTSSRFTIMAIRST
jgi:endo-1,4-beta-mannosidase